MGDQEEKEDKNLKFDAISIKIQRFFKKYEFHLSKALIVISFIIFLFESIILSLLLVLNEITIIIILFLFLFGGYIIFLPIITYLKIIKQLNSSQIKSYEMMGTLIFLIASLFPEFTISFQIENLFVIYTGSYISAVIASSSFIAMGRIFVPKRLIQITKNLNMESIKSNLEKKIHFLEEKSKLLEKKFKESLESIERNHNFEHSNELLKIYSDNLVNYESLILRRHQLYQLEMDPKILRKLAKNRAQEKIKSK